MKFMVVICHSSLFTLSVKKLIIVFQRFAPREDGASACVWEKCSCSVVCLSCWNLSCMSSVISFLISSWKKIEIREPALQKYSGVSAYTMYWNKDLQSAHGLHWYSVCLHCLLWKRVVCSASRNLDVYQRLWWGQGDHAVRLCDKSSHMLTLGMQW